MLLLCDWNEGVRQHVSCNLIYYIKADHANEAVDSVAQCRTRYDVFLSPYFHANSLLGSMER